LIRTPLIGPAAVHALEVCQLSKHFGRTVALQDINLAVNEGDTVALLGPNGAGKTTLMRVCATLFRPSHGSIHIFGRDARREGGNIRRRIGFLSHQTFLYPDLTAMENLVFYARLFRLDQPARRASSLLERMNLSGWAHTPVRALSRGAQQRCALARALLHEPDLLLLDEPFTGLDLAGVAILREILKGTTDSGATLLMSTHDLPRAFELCRSAVVLQRGRIAWHGALDAADRSTFESDYNRILGRSQGAGTPPAELS
jgi:heme exporter protein A